ncbi:MAG: 50S ribosomal protein L29 [Patescibacteria group bacterium]
MKKKEKIALHGETIENLRAQVNELTKKLANLRLARVTAPAKNVHEAKMLRQRIAAIKTILREKEL